MAQTTHLGWFRLRTDGRFEVADLAAANQELGCRVDGECILLDGHAGPCSYDREVWAGPDTPYPG